MNVAKYIGLFLLKNNSCYIHGLGNIELRRKPATFDGRNLLAALYEVVVAPTMNIDDSLSNFIATNEQISISKATNALKDFSEEAKMDLQAGKDVHIPSLGSFSEVNGKLIFNTAPYLQLAMPALPADKSIPKQSGEKKPIPQLTDYAQPVNTPAYTSPSAKRSYEIPVEEKEKAKLNWGRIIFFILILFAIIAGIVFAARHMLQPGGMNINSNKPQIHLDTPVIETVPKEQTPIVDSAQLVDTAISMPEETATTTPATTAQAVQMANMKVIIGTYDERLKAERYLSKLQKAGVNVELKADDSNAYYVVIPVAYPVNNKAKTLDSLRRRFNPLGVYEY